MKCLFASLVETVFYRTGPSGTSTSSKKGDSDSWRLHQRFFTLHSSPLGSKNAQVVLGRIMRTRGSNMKDIVMGTTRVFFCFVENKLYSMSTGTCTGFRGHALYQVLVSGMSYYR